MNLRFPLPLVVCSYGLAAVLVCTAPSDASSTPAPKNVVARCTPPSTLVSDRVDYQAAGTPEVLILSNHEIYGIPAMSFGSMGIVLHEGDPIQICARVPGRSHNQIGGRCAFVYNAANGSRAELCPPETPSPAPIPSP